MKFASDVVIGLEVHFELNTLSKLFCGCATSGSDEPNTRTCPVCLGHPGSRPVLNKKALDYAIKLCIALECGLQQELVFSRKSYFYPDMSKNFQITQFDQPLGKDGKLSLKSGKVINIERIHMEEDPAALVYPKSVTDSDYVFVDYNRAGNPLVEIVTKPEFTTPAEARDFLNKLITILSYLKIFDPNSCLIKADANVSVRESGYTRVEIKNITGFRELERALSYEITRQRALLRRGLRVARETRGWIEVGKTTTPLRKKETEDDYGYIVEPDLPIVDITEQLVDILKSEIPELAHQKAERYVRQYGLDKVDAEVVATELELAELFERIAGEIDPRLAARWMRRELLRVLNYNKKSIRDIRMSENHLIELLGLVESRTITDTTAQKLMEKLIECEFSPKEFVERNGLGQLNDQDRIRDIIVGVLRDNHKAIEDYRHGEEKAFNYLVGQVMRATQGKAEPQVTHEILKKELASG
ncbi:MAG: Asp-tRNA(Asn)/Glu-tRNA(Gln) amidotransferase subunit GatB [archaeon]